MPPHPSTAPRPPTPPGATSAAHLPTRYVPLSHPEEIEGAPAEGEAPSEDGAKAEGEGEKKEGGE